MKTNVILEGHVLHKLKELAHESVDCIVTSPPYWGLRDYGTKANVLWPDGWKGQLGLEPTFELFIKHLCNIFDEIKRVLKRQGTCWVNLGDTYAGSWGAQSHDLEGDAKRAGYNGRSPMSYRQSVPDKSLCMIPSRFTIEMMNRGWILRNTLIWHKPNCMPSSVTDRFTVDFEYLFFFTKNKRYHFETQYEPLTNGHTSGNGEHSRLNTHMGSSIPWDPQQSPLGRQKRTIWTIPTHSLPEAHFATFPPALVETPIKAGCPKGGLVLDPFFGSGTTGLVAEKLGRKFIGIEINPAYIKIAKKRLKSVLEQLTSDFIE